MGELVGRDAEIGALRLAREAARTSGRIVLLEGEAGIGKSTLLRAFCAQVDDEALIGACLPLAGELPYGPFLEIFRGRSERVHAALTGATPTPRAAAFELVLSDLEQTARRRPLILAIEDLHWSDTATRDLFHVLGRSRIPGLLLLATVRPEELLRHPSLMSFIQDLGRGDDAARVALRPLGAEDSATLVAAVSAGLTPDVVRSIVELSGGVPLFLRELAEVGDRDGLPSVSLVLGRRVDALEPASRRLVDVLAVAARPVTMDLLATVLDTMTRDDLERAARDAVTNAIVVVAGDRFELRHQLFGVQVLADRLPTELSRMHEEVARALESVEGESAIAEIAVHWHRAGDAGRALASSIRAAEAARRARAPAEALAHFERAIALWRQDLADAGTDLPDLLVAAGKAAFEAGHYARAAALFDRALADAPNEDHSEVLGMIGRARWLSGDPTGARRAYESAHAALTVSSPPRVRAMVLSGLGDVRSKASGLRDPMLEEALAEAVAGQDPATEALVRVRLSHAPQTPYLESQSHSREAASLAKGIDESLWGEAMLVHVVNLVEWGDLAAVIEVGAPAAARARRIGLVGIHVALTSLVAEAWFRRGSWDLARELLDAARLPGTGMPQFFIALVDALVAGCQGDPVRTRAASETATAYLSDAPEHAGNRFAWARVLTEIELEVGGPLDCTAELDRHLALAPEQPSAPLVAVRGHTELARRIVGHEEERFRHREMAGRWADALLAGEHLQQGAMDAEARAHLRSLDQTASPTDWLDAAERWDEVGDPLAQARCLWHAAEALVVVDRRADATRHLQHAAAIAGQLGAQPFLGRLRELARRGRLVLADDATDDHAGGTTATDAPPFGLTDREAQVLRLLADGLRNTDIAERLFISPKTAGSHVSNILRKLQVRSRVEAAAVAHRCGLVPDDPPT